jgi:hypothetical protein
MKAFLLCSFLLVTAPFASANGFDAKHVPANARWVAHLDVESLLHSQLFTAVTHGHGSLHADVDLHEIEQQFGIDPLKDVRGITVYNAGPGEQDTALLVTASARVEELTAKLSAVEGHASIQVGNRTVHTFQEDGATWYGSIEAGSGNDERLVVLARGEDLYTRALELALGQGKSLASSPTPAIRAKPAAGSILFAAASQNLAELANLGAEQASAVARLAKAFVLDLGEQSGMLSLRLVIDTQKPEDALRVQQVFQGASALLSLMGQDPEQGERIQRLLGALRFDASGSQMTASFRYAVSDLLLELQALDDESNEDDGGK